MTSKHATNMDIPVIDISPANSNAAQQLLDAAVRVGFVFVENKNSIIPTKVINDMFELSKAFFALPVEVKEKVSINSNKAGKNHGWLSQGVEKLDPAKQKRPDVKEAFNIGIPDHATGTFDQPLPDLLLAHRALLIQFHEACHALCQRVHTLFAEALGVADADWFTSRHDFTAGWSPSSTVFRLLYYPHDPTQEPGVDIRAGAHSDYGSVTCLFQLPGQPGLEIRRPGREGGVEGDDDDDDGEEETWVPVPVDPAKTGDGDGVGGLPVLVNFGDLLEDWTGGLLKSTVHRVVFPADEGGAGVDRYSIAYFCHPLDDALLEPVPSRLVEEYAAAHPRKAQTGKPVISAKDHLMERLAATYSIK